MACDPEELMAEAACFACIQPNQRALAILALLCQISEGGGGGGSISVSDEGVPVVDPATNVNFEGAGVVVTDGGGGSATVTISGGGSGVDVEDEGTPVLTPATTLDFVGAGVVVTDGGGGTATVTIAGGGSSGVDIEKDGVAVMSAATVLNFIGDNVTVTDAGGGQADITPLRNVFSNAGDPNGIVSATGPALCMDTTNNIIWWKTTSGTSNAQWIG